MQNLLTMSILEEVVENKPIEESIRNFDRQITVEE